MPALMEPPPFSPVEPVTEVLHGVPVTDPYRWLEDQESPRTRAWISEQTRYARSYLDSIPGRERIRERIRELLDVETYDSLQKVGSRYFFRKRTVGQEQFCICMREGFDGSDEVLVDPALRRTGPHTAVKPLRISPDGRLMLYEVKQGGERTGTFELLDVESRIVLPDVLPRGYLRGFAFAPDSDSFYYVHEAVSTRPQRFRAVLYHRLGTPIEEDHEVFAVSERPCERLVLGSHRNRLVFYVYRFLTRTLTDLYVKSFNSGSSTELILRGIDYSLALLDIDKRLVAVTDKSAPNRRIVEIKLQDDGEPELIDVVPESDCRIETALAIKDRIVVSYMKKMRQRIIAFDLTGRSVDEIPVGCDETVRIMGGSSASEELFFESESFTRPISIFRYFSGSNTPVLWVKKHCQFDSAHFFSSLVSYPAKDGIQIPMHLVGRKGVLEAEDSPIIMTSYGGYGVSMTPQFSVFVAFLMECGCLFALPHIRGGSEFGTKWHEAAKRRNRQTAFDDFLCAAEWLVETRRTVPNKLAIFGGSNSGLLVAAAMTQRPELFAAAVCMVPLLDMLRYHLFDDAYAWREEFGTADDAEDFPVLLSYSPYHRVRDGVKYPATLIVSGDADQKCNSLHARKMTARLQAASVSEKQVLLNYSPHRGHSPVLPLRERIEGLSDRLVFLWDQLQLKVSNGGPI